MNTSILLWDLMRSGDSAALKELYSAYYQFLFRTGFRLCLNHNLTKDCIQDLFLTIWVRRARLPRVSSVGNYLQSALKRKIGDIIKQQHVPEFEVSNEDAELEISYEDVVVAFQAEPETRQKLEMALLLLTKKQREIIKMRYFEHKSFREIGSICGCEPCAIYDHMYEAMRQLRYYLSSTYTS